jgi:hypothetical protein
MAPFGMAAIRFMNRAQVHVQCSFACPSEFAWPRFFVGFTHVWLLPTEGSQSRLRLGGGGATFDFRPRFNITPTQQVPEVTKKSQVELMQWGIVPVWAAESS